MAALTQDLIPLAGALCLFLTGPIVIQPTFSLAVTICDPGVLLVVSSLYVQYANLIRFSL